MFGSKSPKTDQKSSESSIDVAKLFFDTFSSRVGQVEQGLRMLGTELEKIKLASERSQVSDLVLLDRIQRSEGLLEESLHWIRKVAEVMPKRTVRTESPIASASLEDTESETPKLQGPLRRIVSPSGESGSLSSMTTPTEMQVLSMLSEKGALAAPEIGRLVGRSREHTARLMKRLFEEGYVRRDQNRIPFRYSLVDRVKQSFSKAPNIVPLQKEGSPVKGEEKGVVVQPPPA